MFVVGGSDKAPFRALQRVLPWADSEIKAAIFGRNHRLPAVGIAGIGNRDPSSRQHVSAGCTHHGSRDSKDVARGLGLRCSRTLGGEYCEAVTRQETERDKY